MQSGSWVRHGVGAFFALLGCFGVMTLLLVMNARVEKKDKKKAIKKLTFKYQPRRRKPVRRRMRPKPRKVRPRRARRAPLPRLAASLSNVDFGIPGLASTGLEQMSDKLLGQGGDAKNLVMTEKSVDKPPRAVQQVAPKYPPRAQAQSITGKVVLALLIGAQGDVQEVQVVSSEPPGVFDQAAIQAVRRWRFQPAMYKGSPVKVRAQQVLKFELN